jgi:hypothetical protein
LICEPSPNEETVKKVCQCRAIIFVLVFKDPCTPS